MAADRLRVFISSRMQELAAERAAVERALEEIGVDAFVFEGDAGARPGSAVDTYRQELVRSDVYLGLFWLGHGDYTVDEYRTAVRHGLPCLVYEKPPAAGEARDPALQAFLDEIGHVETGHVTSAWFEDTAQLVAWVRRDVERLRTEALRRQIHAGDFRYRAGAAGGRLDAEAPPVVRRRDPPHRACPAPPDPFLGRERALGRVRSALAAGERLVGFRGDPGMGKTSLLARLTADEGDGAVCIAGNRHAARRDVLADVWSRFHETATTFVPDDARLAADLGAVTALVTVDDVALAPDEVQRLADDLPSARLAVAGVSGPGLDPLSYVKAVEVGGFDDPADAVALFAAALGEEVPDELHAAVVAVCAAAGGGPGHIKKLAHAAWGSDLALPEWLAEAAAQDDPIAGVVADEAGPHAADALSLVAAAGPDVPIPAAVATALGVTAEQLAALEGAGLIAAASPRYVVTGAGWRHAAVDPPEPGGTLAATLGWVREAPPAEVAESAGFVLWVLDEHAAADRQSEVLQLARAVDVPLAAAGAWGAWGRALAAAERAATALGDTAALAWARHQLGSRAGALGDRAGARVALAGAAELWRVAGDADGLALTAHNATQLGLAPLGGLGDEGGGDGPDNGGRRGWREWLARRRIPLLLAGAAVTTAAVIGGAVVLPADDDPPPTTPPPGAGMVAFDQNELAFGAGPVGVPASRVLQVANTGDGDATLAVAVEPAGVFAYEGGCPDVLAPGAGCEAVVTFTPPTTGEFTGRLVAGGTTATLRGEGAAGALDVTPQVVDFGVLGVGASVSRVVRVGHDGSSPLALEPLELAGEQPFTLAGSDCGAELAAGATCEMAVTFSPISEGAFAAELVVRAGDDERRIPLAGRGRFGWEVTRVRADDVLNVRAGPGTANPVIGTLAADATGVQTSGRATPSHRSPGWWEVELDDGTVGWSRSDFLRLPAAWTAPFATTPCDLAGTGAQPAARDSTADQVFALDYLESPECHRLVVVLGDTAQGAGTTDVVPTGWEAGLDRSRSLLTVALPDVVDRVRGTATERDFGRAEAYVVRTEQGGLQVKLHLRYRAGQARTQLLTDPARIVVDLVPASEDVIAPLAKSETIVVTRVDQSGGAAVTVSGYGRPFGGLGRAEFRGSGGGDRARAAITAGGQTSGGGEAEFPTADWEETWGAFSVTVDDFGAGDFELFLSDPEPPGEGVAVPISDAGAAGPCSGGGAVAAPPAGVAPIIGDFDGDGDPDRLFAWIEPNAAADEAFVVQVRLAYGYTAELRGPPAATLSADAGPETARDISGDGADEAFVRLLVTGTGRSEIGIFTFADCELVQVRLPTGEPATFVVGGLATASGLECTDGGVDAVDGTTDDGIEYDVVVTPYALDGFTLFPGDPFDEVRGEPPGLRC